LAKKLSDGGKELYNLFIEKWRLIVEISLNRATESDVHNFLQDCRRLENSQSDRDVMFHWGLANTRSTDDAKGLRRHAIQRLPPGDCK
jgi:hypothetical protein